MSLIVQNDIEMFTSQKDIFIHCRKTEY